MVSIRWYLGFLKGQLGGVGGFSLWVEGPSLAEGFWKLQVDFGALKSTHIDVHICRVYSR